MCASATATPTVPQSNLTKVQGSNGKLVSAVYRFALAGENVRITNTLEDSNLFATFLTQNPDCQHSAEGICFDEAGNRYAGNFGDGAVHKITIEGGRAVKNEVWAKDPEQLTATDGLHGELDQPGEPIVQYDKVNTAHEMPAAMAYLDLK